jgi:uncharacterized membrane protein YbhN (UPF0104 family)
LFKAFFIAREQPRRRAQAVATVVVDRVFGACGLVAVVIVALLLWDLPDPPNPGTMAIPKWLLVTGGVGGVLVLVALTLGFTSGRVSRLAAGLPKVGPTLSRLIAALRMYRSNVGVVAVCSVLSVSVHCLLAVTYYCLARALFEAPPTVGEHFIISPLSSVAGALPIFPAGAGTLEPAMVWLYSTVPPPERAGVSGVVVALGYRLITIGIAMMGVVFYWTSRREVHELLEEAEKEIASGE